LLLGVASSCCGTIGNQSGERVHPGARAGGAARAL